MPLNLIAWLVTVVAVFGVIVRPLGSREYPWAIGGALLVVLIGAVPPAAALAAVWRGADVYLFLIGMMLLSEVAREQGLFDWLAEQAVHRSGGSPKRLFVIVYLVGVVVTTLLSNDATAVVLTPAVAAAARAAKTRPLPYLFICAFVANAASFVLPISNPANLVLYDGHLPPLFVWAARFALPSLLSIVVTYLVLHWSQRRDLDGDVEEAHAPPPLSRGGIVAACGIAATAVLLLVSSATGQSLGLPTFVAGVAVAVLVFLAFRHSPLTTLKAISWSVLPLVAGLFVLVEGLDQTGLVTQLANILRQGAAVNASGTAAIAGLVVGFGSNLVNNLPMGLVAATTSQAAQVPRQITDALLIGVDLGPNLSVTGSLATILWLNALRREGIVVGAWPFLKLGALVMTPALGLALGALLLQPR